MKRVTRTRKNKANLITLPDAIKTGQAINIKYVGNYTTPNPTVLHINCGSDSVTFVLDKDGQWRIKEVKKIISICAKCNDLFNAGIYHDGTHVMDYDGYVPDWFPGEHFGDYIMLDIDMDTGQIVNWKKPNDLDIEKMKE